MARKLSLQVPDSNHVGMPVGFILSPDHAAGGGATEITSSQTTAAFAVVMDPETPMALRKEKPTVVPPPVKIEKFTSVRNLFTTQASSTSFVSANSSGEGNVKGTRFPPASGAAPPLEGPNKRGRPIISSVMVNSVKSEDIDNPIDEIEEQSSAEAMDLKEDDTKKDKIWEAHLSGWKTACANLRKKADHDRQELKSCQLKLKSTKAMLRSALDGDFTDISLGAKLLQYVTKNRLQSVEDLTAFIIKADETTLHEHILTATVADLNIELKAQKHGESFGLWKQIEVLKDEKADLITKVKELEEVSNEFTAMKVEYRDLQHLMYETSQKLVRAKQEIAVLKKSKAVPLRAVITMEQLRSTSPDQHMNTLIENSGVYQQSGKSELQLSTKNVDYASGRLSPSDAAAGGGAPVELPMVTPVSRRATLKTSFRRDSSSHNDFGLTEGEEGLERIMMPGFGGNSNPKFMQDLASAAKRKRMAEELRGIDSLKSIYTSGSSHSIEMIAFEKEKKSGIKGGPRKDLRRRSSLFN